MPRVHAAPGRAAGVSASWAAVIARSAPVQVSPVSLAQTTSCCTRARTALAARPPSAARDRDARVGDQPEQDAAHVGAVLSGLVPHARRRRPGRQHDHIDRAGRDG